MRLFSDWAIVIDQLGVIVGFGFGHHELQNTRDLQSRSVNQGSFIA